MIWVTPLSALQQTLDSTGARRVLTLLSQGTSLPLPPALRSTEWLHLGMHDIAGEVPGYTAPSASHVESMLEFGLNWKRAQEGPLIVHCYAGISRSTAAAYVIAAALRPDRDEEELALELRRLAPTATPNPLIVAHADRLLGRNGRMSEAIRRIGRGAEASEGTPFCLRIGG